MSATVRQWDIGTWIEIDMGEDVSAAIERRMHYRKPTGETGTWVAVDRSADVIGYQTVDGDLDVSGAWRLQGWCEFPNGSWTSTEATLHVEPSIARVT